MRRTTKVAIIAGICAAIAIGGLALFVHFKLSEIEKNETEQERAEESAEDIVREALEVLSGKEPHPESEESHSESEESHSEEGESDELHEKLP
ncbi:MAG: hypothetical protein WD018_04640 [Nitrosopumilaceae archaeon]